MVIRKVNPMTKNKKNDNHDAEIADMNKSIQEDLDELSAPMTEREFNEFLNMMPEWMRGLVKENTKIKNGVVVDEEDEPDDDI